MRGASRPSHAPSESGGFCFPIPLCSALIIFQTEKCLPVAQGHSEKSRTLGWPQHPTHIAACSSPQRVMVSQASSVARRRGKKRRGAPPSRQKHCCKNQKSLDAEGAMQQSINHRLACFAGVGPLALSYRAELLDQSVGARATTTNQLPTSIIQQRASATRIRHQ